MFDEDEWHDQAEFLKEVSEVPFACAEILKQLSWIVPCASVEKVAQQGKRAFRLTSLRMAASHEVQKLVWTIKPIVQLPQLSYYHLKLSRIQWAEKRKVFFNHLQVCTEPQCTDVVKNIENISNSRFSDFKLFDTYTKECIAQKGKEGLLFGVLVDCFTYLQQKDCSQTDLVLSLIHI